jgi:hypothetical protein
MWPHPSRRALARPPQDEEIGRYACGDYTRILRDHDIQASMSRIGNPYDNAKAESFMKTRKQEEVEGSAYRNIADARARIGSFIEAVYNCQRLHSALDYVSPEEYELTASVARMERSDIRGLLSRISLRSMRATRATRAFYDITVRRIPLCRLAHLQPSPAGTARGAHSGGTTNAASPVPAPPNRA